MPRIQFALQAIALGQKLGVFRREIIGDLRKSTPPEVAVDTGSGQDLVLDKAVQDGIHLQTVASGACCHLLFLNQLLWCAVLN